MSTQDRQTDDMYLKTYPNRRQKMNIGTPDLSRLFLIIVQMYVRTQRHILFTIIRWIRGWEMRHAHFRNQGDHQGKNRESERE